MDTTGSSSNENNEEGNAQEGQSQEDEDMECGGLVNQFLTLGTTDRDVLISQLQKLVEPGTLPNSAASFFLDMNNWNLGLAIGAYFDLTSDNITESNQVNNVNYLPRPNFDAWPMTQYSMSLVNEVNSSMSEVIIPPRTRVTQRWRLKNSGTGPWPLGTNLRFRSGQRNLADNSNYILPEPVVQAGEVRDIGLEFLSPGEIGNYEMRWQLSTPEGYYFGDEIWIIIQVGEDPTADITSGFYGLSTRDFNLENGQQSPRE